MFDDHFQFPIPFPSFTDAPLAMTMQASTLTHASSILEVQLDFDLPTTATCPSGAGLLPNMAVLIPL